MTSRQLNVRPDAPDFRDRMYVPTLRVLDPRFNPEPYDNELLIESVQDQGETEACSGFALSSMVERLCTIAHEEKPGFPNPVAVSPQMLYYYARRYDDIPGEDPSAGSTARGAMKAWYKNGACSRSLWETAVPPPPSVSWQEDAFQRPLGAYFRVDHTSVPDMHAALNETQVIYVTAMIHSGWDSPRDGIIPYDATAQDLGGHAFLIVGYDEDGFLIQNSWGRTWGRNGFAHLTYPDWQAHAHDAWVAQLGVNISHHADGIAQGLRYSLLEGGAPASALLSSNSSVTMQLINPYIIDLQNNGALSDSGDYHTNPADLSLLVTQYLNSAVDQWGLTNNQYIDVAMYAHGGLTSEDDAAKLAQIWIPQLFSQKIFPVFFMWETGKLETLEDIYQDWLSKQAGAASASLWSRAKEYWDERMESILSPAGTLMWNEMKKNAQAASENPEGGIEQLYNAFKAVPQAIRSRLRLHLIGHSAGSIFHAFLLPRLIDAGLNVDGVYFMAPAITVDLFQLKILPAYNDGKVATYTQFELSDTCEQNDNCLPLPYYHSLLYLVSNAFENTRGTPILGMQKFFAREAPNMPRLNANTIVCPTQPGASPDSISTNSTHGGFGQNPATINSILKRIDERRKAKPALAGAVAGAPK